jgi:hypothetical protein
MLHGRVQCVSYRASRIRAGNEVHSVPYRRRVHRVVVRFEVHDGQGPCSITV